MRSIKKIPGLTQFQCWKARISRRMTTPALRWLILTTSLLGHPTICLYFGITILEETQIGGHWQKERTTAAPGGANAERAGGGIHFGNVDHIDEHKRIPGSDWIISECMSQNALTQLNSPGGDFGHRHSFAPLTRADVICDSYGTIAQRVDVRIGKLDGET
jgi:hypothetical protein